MIIINTLIALILNLVPQYGISSEIKFDPTTTWPYVYEDFAEGTVLSENGSTLDYNLMNVNLVNNTLHYVKDGVIMQVNMSTVYVVRIKGDVYLNAMGKLMKVDKESENGAVVTLTEIDKEKMSRSNIGYGTSAVASTQNVGLHMIEGALGGLNKSLSSSVKDKYNGDNLILKETTYLIVDGLLIAARKKDISTDERFDSKKIEAYFKSHKIKWNKTENLSELVEFLHTAKIN